MVLGPAMVGKTRRNSFEGKHERASLDMPRAARRDHDAWGGIALFENHDYVTRWYLSKHGRSLNARWTAEINASFRQGREYFDSAAIGGPTVKPLLLYYGCAALARGALLVLSPKIVPDMPSPSHGLTTHQWQATLEPHGVRDILDLAIRSQPGLFPDFVRAVGNGSTVTVRTESGDPTDVQFDHGATSFAGAAGGTLTLRALLERDHRLASLFNGVTGDEPRVHWAQVTAHASGPVPDRLSWAVVGSPNRLSAGLATKLFGEASEIRSIGGRNFKYVPDVHLDWSTPKDATTGAPMLAGDFGDTWLAENFDNGDRFALVHRTYLLAYILGMVSRYHPAIWSNLLQNTKGAFTQPLIRAALDIVEVDFPTLLWGYLARWA